jgi:15-cis-phytoene desaturase
MSNNCDEYADEKRSMLELVFAPCSPEAGASVNWIAKTDAEIVDATMKELERLFPAEVGPGVSAERRANLVKSTVVRVPRSVYAATPGRNKFRPSQVSPIDNFVMAGDYATQKYLGSMEGAVLSGKLAAEVICDKAMGRSNRFGLKEVHSSVRYKERSPVGIAGISPLSFGGGQQGSFDNP